MEGALQQALVHSTDTGCEVFSLYRSRDSKKEKSVYTHVCFLICQISPLFLMPNPELSGIGSEEDMTARFLF